jgi:hypothetical protein
MTMITVGAAIRPPANAASTTLNSIVATAATACALDTAYNKGVEARRRETVARTQHVKRERENGRV